ncbi:glucose 1-dehydrogenase [Desulforhabdus sp. TSK]|uniref:glucose 1-dehydrogenase n=1 Tax=Desulforhabdus sp. TSK TaxID=2925014 RepID=UPI001FC885BE|nr:glucose 1-dehydrogenase [Desulforhabdus sp. TSK]GKT09437.1 oxidoreductase [Desulforhabdus sp. TSK]
MAEAEKVAVVTGGGQGIGKGIAERLLRDGFAVVLAEWDEEAGNETETELHSLGRVQFIRTDVGDEGMVKAAMEKTEELFGGVDLLVNNAGIMVRKPILDLSLGEWNRALATNLTGIFLCSRYAAPSLRMRKGSILNIASTRALMSEKDTEAYSATKGGVVALTHALAVSLGPEIRVNCISPGWIDVSEWRKRSERQKEKLTHDDHSQHPAGRVGKPEDIAAMLSFLVSPEASFITGANFVVDGGMTRKMIYI